MRFIGSKVLLLKKIEEVIKNNIQDAESFCDIFSGTASVARYFKKNYQIIRKTFTCCCYLNICIIILIQINTSISIYNSSQKTMNKFIGNHWRTKPDILSALKPRRFQKLLRTKARGSTTPLTSSSLTPLKFPAVHGYLF